MSTPLSWRSSRSPQSPRSPRSPASPSTVPPPITSLLLPSKHSQLAQSQRLSSPSFSLQALSERQRALERRLQQHLDSQSEALSDPTLSSTLRDARRGILRGMRELKASKSAERDILQAQADSRIQRLEKADLLRQKVADLEAKEAERLGAFRTELGNVEDEIQKLEGRLLELRTRRDHLRNEVDGIENGVAARTSSYREALRVLEKEIDLERRQALKNPLSENDMEMHLEKVGKEDDALEQGIDLFSAVLSTLATFEKSLSVILRSTNPKRSSLRAVFEEAEQELEHALDKCEAEGWNLLIAAVGVELEALQHGWDIVKDMLPASDDGDSADDTTPASASVSTTMPHHNRRSSQSQSQIGALQASSSTYKTSPSSPQLKDGIRDERSNGSAAASKVFGSRSTMATSKGTEGNLQKQRDNDNYDEDSFDHVPADLLVAPQDSDDEAADEPDPGLLFVQS